MKSTLTLALAVQTCRQAEARKQSRELVHGETKPNNVDFVKRSTTSNRSSQKRKVTNKVTVALAHKRKTAVDGVVVNVMIVVYVLPETQHVINVRNLDTLS